MDPEYFQKDGKKDRKGTELTNFNSPIFSFAVLGHVVTGLHISLE